MYCTKDDILNRLTEDEVIELSSETNTINESIINECINDADREIDLFLANHYEVPLTAIPEIIKRISCELTIVNLNKRRNVIDEEVDKRYEYVTNLLSKLSTKELILAELISEDEEPTATGDLKVYSLEQRGW